MDCKKCDRCGKIYPADYKKYKVGSYIITTAPPEVKVIYTWNDEQIAFRDICDDCKKSFDRWFASPEVYVKELSAEEIKRQFSKEYSEMLIDAKAESSLGI